MEYGFVGLGQMGEPMAINLASKHPVTVYCRGVQRREAWVERGISAAAELRDLAAANVIFLCLPNTKVVEDVLFGNGELAEVLQPETIVFDTSTIDYAATVKIAARLADKNVSYIDAPISGMQARAEEGSLTMMCGGREDLIDDLRPALSTMATNILYMGPTGSGQLMKLINQLLFDINAAAIAEVLPLAVKLGLDPDKVAGVVNNGTGRSFASEFFIPNILKNKFEDGYPMAAAYKDLVSGAEISAQHRIPTPVLAAATSTYQQALLAGHGDKDKGGMICVFEDLLGIKFRSGASDKDER